MSSEWRKGPQVAALNNLPEPETIEQAIGRNIRTLRVVRGMTLEEMTKRLGKSSVGWLSQVERGDTGPTPRSLYNLAIVLGCEVSDLLPTVAEALRIEGLEGGCNEQ